MAAPKKRVFQSSPKDSGAARALTPPKPFQKPPAALETFIDTLDPAHVYVTHIDAHPIEHKRKIFLLPVGINILVVLCFALRMQAILPFYWSLISAALGSAPADLFRPEGHEWSEILWEGVKRASTFSLDMALFIFVWPWPVEFVVGTKHGSPVHWRLQCGFKKQEVCVRRSRDWDTGLQEIMEKRDVLSNFLIVIRAAIAPSWISRKTGYLMINREWDLDWDLMMIASTLVSTSEIDVESFDRVVLLHHKDFGWLSAVLEKEQEEVAMLRKKQVLSFKQALAALGKENLFYRWVETVQYEATTPGGFTAAKQEEAAKKIRDMFKEQDVDFDKLWKESTATV